MTTCPACGGDVAYLGQLGTRVHGRCVDCGLDSSHRASEYEQDRYGDLLLEQSRGELEVCDVDE